MYFKNMKLSKFPFAGHLRAQVSIVILKEKKGMCSISPTYLTMKLCMLWVIYYYFLEH